MTDASVIIIAAAFLLAGFVKGMIGLGLPTVAIGLLSLAMTPAEAAALLVVPSLVTNLWQMATGPRLVPLLRRLWPMMLGIAVGTQAGAPLLLGGNAALATAALGMALMLYAVTGLAAFRLAVPARAERWLSPLAGLATGIVTAATGVLVIPAVPYLQALSLERDELVQALGLSFTVSTLALAIALVADGAFGIEVAGVSLLALAPALIGMWVGQLARGRASPGLFRLCFFLGLLALGGHLALHGLI